MTNSLKNIFSDHTLSYIFQKHHWHSVSNSKNYHFNYKGEIADYYLTVSYNNNIIKFEYTLDIEIPDYKISDLLLLINFVNQKNGNGFFIYDFKVNRVKFHISRQYFVKLKNKIIEDVIEDNLNITNHLFCNFALAIHNLVYAEQIDQNCLELMFLKIEGYA